MRHTIFMWKTPTNCGDKKPRGLRPINRNPLFEIKSHKFTWPLYPKCLHSITYNLIHVCDITTICCSLVYFSVTSKGLRSSTNNSNNQSLKERTKMVWQIRLFTQRVPIKNTRSPTNSKISMIFLISNLSYILTRNSNPQRVTRKVFIGKIHKDFHILSFQICI